MEIQQDTLDGRSNTTLADFSKLYNNYYVLLCTIADNYLKDKYLAEEAVGEVFLNFWEKYNNIVITTSVKAYLVRSVQNWCVNFIHHQKVEQKLKQKIETEGMLPGLAESSEYPLGSLYEKELAAIISNAINALPDQCRRIFLLSRDEGLTYDEISERLNISVNTIKTQIKIALAKLREWLKDYLPIFIIAFLAWF